MKFHDLFSTITNLAFMSTGICVWNTDWYVGLCLIGLGVCSWMYHSQKTRFWRHSDIIAIYFVLLSIISYLSVGWHPLAFLFGCVLGILHADIHPMDSRIDNDFLRSRSWLTIGVLGAVILILCFIFLPIWQTLSMLGCFSIWGGLNLIWNNRDNLDWPYWVIDLSHALTHIAAATGIYFII